MPAGSTMPSTGLLAWKPRASSSVARLSTKKSKYLKNPRMPRFATMLMTRNVLRRAVSGSPYSLGNTSM